MAKRLARSNEQLPLQDVYAYKHDAEQGLRRLFAKPENKQELLFLTPSEVEMLLSERIQELERQASLTLIASLEAMFQLDFRSRLENRGRDALSKKIREIKWSDMSRISFEFDVLRLWEEVYPQTRKYLQPLRSILKYRHWLAHGRYWLLKHPKFDFDDLYERAEACRQILQAESMGELT